MGSLDKYCRLCALNVRPDQLLKLFEDDPNKIETPNGTKLRNFLSFTITPEDRLPKQVCAQCVSNLDYCIQFVDKCRRIESLLQRGLDVDYVASEVDYRYTYLFPSPYPGHDSRPAYPEFPDTGGSYFGNSQATEQVPTTNHDKNNENIGLNLSQIPDRVSNERNDQESQFSSHEQNTYLQGRLEAPIETRSNPGHPNNMHEKNRNSRTSENNNKPPANSQASLQRAQTAMPAVTTNTPLKQPPGISSNTAVKTENGQQKVAMYRNDVSVDNMVVEIEPNDLFPRKAGNVKQEYPWKVGGATKRSLALKEKKSEPEKKSEKESPPKKMRSILPKFEAPTSKPASAPSSVKGVNQIMIPVTLKTPCKSCNKLIVASSLNDLKNHICGNEDKSLECTMTNCHKKFGNKNALKYHQKHCHNSLVNPNTIKKDIDIMSIATNELVGCGDASKNNISYQMLENSSYAGNQPGTNQPVGLTYQESYQASPRQHTNSKNSSVAKKVYACPYEGCTKSYNAKTYLVQHERLHTGERPFSCANCGKGFSRVLDMKKHSLLKVCY